MIIIILYFMSLLLTQAMFSGETRLEELEATLCQQLPELEQIYDVLNFLQVDIDQSSLEPQSKENLHNRLEIPKKQYFFILNFQDIFSKQHTIETYYQWKRTYEKNKLTLLGKVEYPVQRTNEVYLIFESKINDLTIKTEFILLLLQQFFEEQQKEMRTMQSQDIMSIKSTKKRWNFIRMGKFAILFSLIGGGIWYGRSQLVKLYSALLNRATPILQPSLVYPSP